MMKDDLGGVIITELFGLCPKMYFHLKGDGITKKRLQEPKYVLSKVKSSLNIIKNA